MRFGSLARRAWWARASTCHKVVAAICDLFGGLRGNILGNSFEAAKVVKELRGRIAKAARSAPLILCVAVASCSAPPKPILEAAAIPVAAPVKPAPDIFATIAGELLNALEPDKRIAIQPFRAADLPIALSQAQAFNDALARAIEASPEGRAVIVAREELPRLFAEAEEFGEAKDTARLLEAARADVLVVGSLAPTQGGVTVTYKAFDAKSGRQLASALPRFQAVDTAAPRGMPLDQAIATAADALARQAPDMRSVETLGVYFQQSDVQTALGGYVARTVVGRLAEKINGLSASPAALLRPEAVDKLDAGGAEEIMVRARPGVFLLSGTLWDLGSDVELRLTLKGVDRTASTGVRVRRDAIPPGFLPLAPTGVQSARREALPFDLQLSSDRGRRPVYAAGDQAHLIVQAARAGYLYCFHQASPAAGGGITKIFPNPYHANARVQGQSSVHIPDQSMNFMLKVYGPGGVEQVRCFALDRDVEATLPSVLMGRGLEPLAMPSLEDIAEIFRAAPAGVAEASLTMTVETRGGTRRAAGDLLK